MSMIYCSYPYSENPQKCTEEINAICKEIYEVAHLKANDIILLIPHNIFDRVFDFPVGNSNFWMPMCELVLIERCDAFAYDPNRMSAGVIWEKAYAEKLKKPIFTFDQLRAGARPKLFSEFSKEADEISNKLKDVSVTETEIAWAAGFYDGEGSTSCRINNGKIHTRLQLSIGQKDYNGEISDTLLKFKNTVKIGKIYQKTRIGKEINQHQFLVCIPTDVCSILDLMWKYLSVAKKDQAKKCLELYHEGTKVLTQRFLEKAETVKLKIPIKYYSQLREMRNFDSGATRDSADDKPDLEGYLSPAVIKAFGQYMLKHQKQADGKLRGSDNWQLGIPRDQYLKSAWRHFLDLWLEHRGYESRDGLEEALGGLLFNIMGYWFEILKEESIKQRDELTK